VDTYQAVIPPVKVSTKRVINHQSKASGELSDGRELAWHEFMFKVCLKSYHDLLPSCSLPGRRIPITPED
jgi:hypothetical protein